LSLRKAGFCSCDGLDSEISAKTESVEVVAIGMVGGDAKQGAKAASKYQGALVDVSAILAAKAAGVLLQRWAKRESEFLGYVEGSEG
jgi:hypothetical protein